MFIRYEHSIFYSKKVKVLTLFGLLISLGVIWWVRARLVGNGRLVAVDKTCSKGLLSTVLKTLNRLLSNVKKNVSF